MDEKKLLEYKKRMIDSVSSSFCAAKWLNATLWLGTGRTSSCHHPPSHEMNREEIKATPAAIHNTMAKKVLRKQMLEGKRPSECEYCWKIEDLGPEVISDRVFKTIIYDDESVKDLATRSWKDNINPQTLEVSFNRVCNLACSYCGPTYSSAWGKDIQKHGAFNGLLGDCRGEFSHDGARWDMFASPEENPYLQAFWQWWPELSLSLKELRLTGGEPLMSSEVWKLIDIFIGDQLPITLAVNSNLSAKDDLIDRLIEKSHSLKRLEIYTSCEAAGAQAEYIRDGLNFDRFIGNCEKILSKGKVASFNVMMTINSLCLFSLTDMIDRVLIWKKQYPHIRVSFTLNPLRFPSFMSPSVLPLSLRQSRAMHIRSWRDHKQAQGVLNHWELASLDRLIEYLMKVEIAHEKASDRDIQHSDFKRFYAQYDQRRKKSFKATFPTELVDWMESLKEIENDR